MGNFYERQDFSPPNEKEKKYTECEYCDGDGWIIDVVYLDEQRVTCPKCHGEGQIEIEY